MALYELLKANMPASIVQWTTPIQAWVPGVTPMSTLPSVFITSAAYLVVVLGGQEIMRFFPAVPAKYVKIPFFIHNLLLSLGSLVLLLLYLERQFLLIRQYDLHDSICRANLFEQSVMFHIINYYFKYWEFVDTFFLVIKKKNLMFLHVYHHMATAMLCYSQIVNRTTLSWVIICLNLAVHVIMYSYYAFASIGIRCPWKKWITTGQILQFVIDVAVCVYGIYHHYAPQAKINLPYVRYCHGEPAAAFSGLAILVSYLFLFILFYKKTYKKPAKASVSAKKMQ
ncbi:fatty acid elongase [Malassezia pachydermatis]|uniref:Elongation of fatty acids protein n=1 Tax=Malassezia pachydermatis TaxID=77020 RepID=A0A0M8MTU5_9BASI|nr:fatty acid elongase [Malassezia pachydermatis]KOS13680.1 fatty acid elongase [Malassezia pachydermatis]